MIYEEYRTKVIECRKSGKGTREWCRESGIAHETLRTWRKRVYRKEGAAAISLECGQAAAEKAAPKAYAQYRQKVLECRGSGLTMEEWCRQEGVKYNGYRTWQRKVAKKEGLAAIDLECGRKPRERMDAALLRTQQNPRLFEMAVERETGPDIRIEEKDGETSAYCGLWRVTGYGVPCSDVIKAVKRICC